MAHKKQYDDNDGKHIEKIVNASKCKRHSATEGQACWNVMTKEGVMRAICDRRARAAGANGDIELSTKKEYAR